MSKARKAIGAVAALCLPLGLLALPVAAQGIQPNPEREPERAIEIQRRSDEAARAAAERRGDLGPRVTYEQLLTAPDDIALNLRYVEQQIAGGEIRSALAALERVLSLQPENARARLLYGLVLFRLDNLAEAERELRAIRGLPMPDSLRAEIDGYLGQIEQRRKLTRITANFSFGGHYDTNRDAGPSSGTRRAIGIDTEAGKGEDDFAVLGIGTVELRHDLGLQAKHDVFGRVTFLLDDQFELRQQDLQALFVELGGTWRNPETTLIPSLTASKFRLNQEGYLESIGVKLRAERRLDAAAQAFAEGHLQYQEFDNVVRSGRQSGHEVSTAPTADLMTGIRFDADAGLIFTLAPEHQLTASAGYVGKEARIGYNAYDGGRLQLSHLWLLGRGQFLLSALSFERLFYDEADPIVDPTVERRDNIYRARLTWGAPLASLFGDGLPEGVGDILWTATGELTRSASNLPNYTYTNLRLQALLSKRWEF